MRKGIILILFLLIAKLAICQTGYPKKIVIDKDTVIVITIPQMQLVNGIYLQLSECREIYQQASVALDSCILALNIYDSTDKNLKVQNSILSTSVVERDTLIAKAAVLDKENKTTIKKLKNQNTLLKLSGMITIVAIILLSIL